MTKWNLEMVKKEVVGFIKQCETIYGREFDKNIKVEINSRLTSSFGYFKFQGKKSLEIDIAKRLIDSNLNELIIDTIGHEVAHYIMHELGYYNEKHGERFKKLCGKLGIETISYGKWKNEMLIEQRNILRKNIRENKKNELYNKKNNARYILKCKYCDCAGFYKVARKDSIEKWVLRYSCCNKQHKNSLVCYDIKENLKYEKVSNKLKKSKMTKEDKEICEKIVSKKY